ncbi:MAG: SRPBCC family protein [Bacteroidetes bacterium]|nr:SRPBCC family protein [Bacteroidota bacterium]
MTNKTSIKAEPGKQDLFIEREFDAPRELVFRAFTEKDLIVQFLGPKNMKMEIEHYDMRSGGSYRYIHMDEHGNQFAFHGSVHEVSSPLRMIQTFEFEGLPERGHVSMDTSIFEELPGNRTKLTIQSVFRSVSDRDGMIMSGMERGINEGFERLDQMLKSQVSNS